MSNNQFGINKLIFAKSSTVPKFLLVRFSSIGDIVLTTPVVRCLKKQLPDAEIHFLTKTAFEPVVKHNPYIDKIQLLEKSFSRLCKILMYEHYDYMIDLHKNIRTVRLKNRLKIISFSFNKLNLEKWLLVNFNINRLPDEHIVDRYLKTAQIFDVKNDNAGLDYFIPPEDEISTDTLPESFRKGYIGFVIGAKHETKKLPVHKIISLIKKINLPVVLLGGKEDMDTGKQIANEFPHLVFNACGVFRLNQSASLVKKARLILTHDTGLMHLAAAFKKKIISFWGNTIPEFGMYPYMPDKSSVIFQVPDLSCRPCSKLGYTRCPKKHFHCMELLPEKDIAQLAKNLFTND